MGCSDEAPLLGGALQSTKRLHRLFSDSPSAAGVVDHPHCMAGAPEAQHLLLQPPTRCPPQLAGFLYGPPSTPTGTATHLN